jgi:hypothetical protein
MPARGPDPPTRRRRSAGRWARRLAAPLLALLALLLISPGSGVDPRPAPLAPVPTTALPERSAPLASEPGRRRSPIRKRIGRAGRWLEGRPAPTSFAVVGRDGKLRGVREHVSYPAASIVKAMLLAAETRRLKRSAAPLDAGTRGLLGAMITYSDNDAAGAIYSRLGDEGLNAIAAEVGMEDFEVAGHWGNARVSAADMALFFDQLDETFPSRFERYAKGLLGAVTESQRWGIPSAAAGYRARFKGGWRPTEIGQLVHQAAELRDGRRRLSIAVLTDGQPSMAVGVETIEGVTARLLGSR